MGFSDSVTFIAIVIFVIFYVCVKICCFSNHFKDETDEEAAGQRAMNSRNQQPARPYIITTRLTGYQQSLEDCPHPHETTGPTYTPHTPTAPQPDSYYSIPQLPSAPQPQRNLSEDLDLPPSFEEAIKQVPYRKPHY